jgi:hypothetical protein
MLLGSICMKKENFLERSTYPPVPYDLMCTLKIIEREENNLGGEKKTRSAPSVVN